jgi:hypothetical protein
MTDEPLYQAHGITGSILCWRDRVVIRKKGWPYGTKSDKSIPIRSIGAVQFKVPSMTSGFLQIAYSGSSESKGGVFNAAQDENTVMFVKKDLHAFQTVKGFIEFQQNKLNEPSAPAAAAAPASLADELTKLATLRDQGILTPDEFDAQKARLLG